MSSDSQASQDSVPDPRDLKIAELMAQVKDQQKTITILEEKLAKLESLLAFQAEAKSSKTPVFTENYSLDRNKTSEKKPRKKSTGRKPAEAKRHQVTDTIKIFADGVDHAACIEHRSQFAWRIIEGKAVYLCYEIYDLPDSTDLPLPPGLRNNRSEFGIEVILILAFLHYWVGVSIDNAIQIMNFFTGLNLSKSQADSLLSQLATDWNEQYDMIAELIALQTIVYIDETGWKVGDKSCYTWIFSTSMHVLFRCGVSRKKTEATAVLGDSFAGIGVTDDYAAYKNMFTEHQLCWAHLIRKAIKLMLQNPEETEYVGFWEALCLIYHDAKELSKQVAAAVEGDPLNTADGRRAVIEELQARITELCDRRDETIITTKAAAKAQPPVEPTTPHVAAFINLQRELAEQLECLFVFVEHPEVEPTNNRSERNVRREAEIRQGARTSKSAAGAKRRGTIVTVFASLQTRISNFTLANMLAEIDRWTTAGVSLFQRELDILKTNLPPPTRNTPV
jgi:transposase